MNGYEYPCFRPALIDYSNLKRLWNGRTLLSAGRRLNPEKKYAR
jgi:hypothetical protein